MKKQLRVKSISSFITELPQSQRYFNCACWEVLLRDTSHFQQGPQGGGIIKQFHSCWLKGNIDILEEMHPRITWNVTPEQATVWVKWGPMSTRRDLWQENPKIWVKKGWWMLFPGFTEWESEAGSTFPMGRKLCCLASVARKDLWVGSILTGKPFKSLDHDSTRNHVLWAAAFCPTFITVAWRSYCVCICAHIPIVWPPCTAFAPLLSDL